MQLFRVFLRGLLFFGLVFGISSSLGFLIYDRVGAAVLTSLVGGFLLWNTLRWKALWTKALRARRVQILGRIELYYVNDPSSHLFLMKSPIGPGGAVFMTRGILSLLNPDELEQLVAECDQAIRRFGWGWNVFLSTLQLRVMKLFSSQISQFFYTSTLPAAGLTPWMTLKSLPGLGVLDILRRFFLPTNVISDETRKAKSYLFDRLLAESYICPPRVPAAASAHALINPWPRALFRTSESCFEEKA